MIVLHVQTAWCYCESWSGHHLLAAEVECTAFTNLNWGGGSRSRDSFCLKSPVHSLLPKAKSPKPASQGLLRALHCCQLLDQGQALCPELGFRSPLSRNGKGPSLEAVWAVTWGGEQQEELRLGVRKGALYQAQPRLWLLKFTVKKRWGRTMWGRNNQSYSLSRVDYRCSVSFNSPCGSKVPEPRLCLAKGEHLRARPVLHWHLLLPSCRVWLAWKRKQLLLTPNTTPSSTEYFSEGSKPLNGFIF